MQTVHRVGYTTYSINAGMQVLYVIAEEVHIQHGLCVSFSL